MVLENNASLETFTPSPVDRTEIEATNLDLSIKRLQLARLQRSEINWSVVLPVISGIIAALIGVGSAVVVAYLNGQSQLDAERYKAQITLIVEAVKTGTNNPLAALKNLRFFADAGLLDPGVKALVERGESPVLPGPYEERDKIFVSVDRAMDHLHPLARSKVAAVLKNLKSEGIPIELYEGFRDPVHQQVLYFRGRVTRSAVSTDTPPWTSLRQYGFAVTLGVHENGSWSWNYENPAQKDWWDRLKLLASSEGLEQIDRDPAAFRVVGIKPEELRRGRYPDGDQVWADHLTRAISNWSGDPPAPPPPLLNSRPNTNLPSLVDHDPLSNAP
jgi:hypothetical protein